MLIVLCFIQAEDGIRDLVRSRGLGDVYKRQIERKVRRRFLSLSYLFRQYLRTEDLPSMLAAARALSLIHI